MADSHGRAEAIAQALAFFRRRGCRRLYHLGDICDSLRQETAAACCRLLQASGVLAVLGNNDHALLTAQLQRKPRQLPAETLAYLQGLPLRRQYRGALMVHSLPFEEALGPAALIGAMELPEARRFCQAHPRGLLLRGHGHRPELICQGRGMPRCMEMAPAERLNLRRMRPCIITCGAVDRGHALLWDPAGEVIESVRLF
jgi:predicted phosphodiesterase